MSEQCPCGNAHEYQQCCEPYHLGIRAAEKPAILMRSRYCAYVKKDADYLINTWHPDCHTHELYEEIVQCFSNTTWHGLTVVAQTHGNNKDEAFVEFIARFTDADNPQINIIHEHSRFLHIKEHWYYIDGVRPSVGRNDICPCGTGKKYKKCCGINR